MAIKVFFNNSCSVCRMEINHYKKIADSNLEWIDITNNDQALKLTSTITGQHEHVDKCCEKNGRQAQMHMRAGHL